MIDQSTIQRVMDAADIVDVVKEFVTLRKAGVNYKGLCPFHDEKTPSFVVSPSKGLCKCFSCGEGGNAVHFIMKHEQLTYPEAIKWLGRKYGIEVQDREQTAEERAVETHRESLFVLNEWARDYFSDILHSHANGLAIGMAYFRSRGFRDDIIRRFQLGYGLASRTALAEAATAKGFNPENIVQTGLCYRNDKGQLCDRYHDRVIFPVHTISGRVVAFGGRILSNDKSVAKYVNSPESDIYSKSKELYGLYFAKHAIMKHDRCYLVEGYTDVISMHQCGIENVVASSGTSLTEGQIRMIHRFTQNITVLYDGDNAGIKASLRGIDMLLREGMNVKVLLLPDGDDPDSFARKHNASEFRDFIEENQVDFIQFKTDLLSSDTAGDPIRQAELIQNIVGSISEIPGEVVRRTYARMSAERLGVSESVIINEVAQQRRQRHETKTETEGKSADKALSNDTEAPSSDKAHAFFANDTAIREEQAIAEVLIRFANHTMDTGQTDEVVLSTVADYIHKELEADNITLKDENFRCILEEACTLPEGTDSLKYFASHPKEGISRLATGCITERYHLSQGQRQGYIPEEERLAEFVPRVIHDYKHTLLQIEMKSVLKQLSDPQVQNDPEISLRLMQHYKDLSAIEREFAQVLGDRVLGSI